MKRLVILSRWGAIASLSLGLIIAAISYVRGALGQAALAWGTAIGALLVGAALLCYLVHLASVEQHKYQARHARLRKRLSEITVLHEVSGAAHDLRSEDALQEIVNVVTGFMRFRRAALFLTDAMGEWLPCAYHSARHTNGGVSEGPLSMAPSLFGAVLEHRRPVLIDGSQGQPETAHAPALQVAVPLHGDSGPIGVLLAEGDDRRVASRSDTSMLANLAQSAAMAIENASLHRRVARMANHDGVTGLYNHRFFQEQLRGLLHGADEQRPISLLMVEVDQFKQYNDSFGHRQGDMALYSLSRALEQAVAPFGGIVARYGGDEFVVILPDVSPREALPVAEEIRDETYRVVSDLLAECELPSLLLSIGVATCPDDASTAGELIEAADQAMYVVKHSGGNGIHVSSSSRVSI